MGMSAWSGHGCAHQGPLLANTTMCWPERKPVTRPEMLSTLSRPPCAAGGILVKEMDGVTGVACGRQPVHSNDSITKAITRQKLKVAGVSIRVVIHAILESWG